MGEDEDRSVERRGVSPPTFPVAALPRTTLWSELVAPHDLSTDVAGIVASEVVVEPPGNPRARCGSASSRWQTPTYRGRPGWHVRRAVRGSGLHRRRTHRSIRGNSALGAAATLDCFPSLATANGRSSSCDADRRCDTDGGVVDLCLGDATPVPPTDAAARRGAKRAQRAASQSDDDLRWVGWSAVKSTMTRACALVIVCRRGDLNPHNLAVTSPSS